MALHRFPSPPILIMEPGRGRDSDTMDVFATRLPLELIRKIASNCSGSAGAASSENQEESSGQISHSSPWSRTTNGNGNIQVPIIVSYNQGVFY